MRKSKKKLAEVAEAYVQELLQKFPEVEPEILLEPVGGFDVYIRLGVPSDMDDGRLRALTEASIDETMRYSDETGVDIITVEVHKEAVHG